MSDKILIVDDEAEIADLIETYAIAQEIVILHGGTIQALSGEETVTFRLRLPRERLC